MTDTHLQSRMRSEDYPEGYWTRAEGSNYHGYGPDSGFDVMAGILADAMRARTSDPEIQLLEVAAATGHFLSACLDQRLDPWGIDISEWAVANRVGDVPPERLLLGNAVDLPFPSQSFDVVCSWEFLEHVYEDEVSRVLDEMIRVLRPGGLFVHRIGITIDGEDVAHQHDDVTHVLIRERDFWESWFEDYGLQRLTSLEDEFDHAFRYRDWSRRFFAWVRPDH